MANFAPETARLENDANEIEEPFVCTGIYTDESIKGENFGPAQYPEDNGCIMIKEEKFDEVEEKEITDDFLSTENPSSDSYMRNEEEMDSCSKDSFQKPKKRLKGAKRNSHSADSTEETSSNDDGLISIQLPPGHPWIATSGKSNVPQLLSMPGQRNVVWTRQATTAFINCLIDYPCVWKVTSKEYKMKNKRQDAWNKIQKNMAAVLGYVTQDDLKKKLNTIRSQFRKEEKLKKNSMKSGAGTADIYQPKLWCYDQVMFFGEEDIQRESTSTLDEDTTTATATDETLTQDLKQMYEEGILEINMDEESIQMESTELDVPLLSPTEIVTYSNMQIPTPAHCSSSSASSTPTSCRASKSTHKKSKREKGLSTNEFLRAAVDKMTTLSNKKDDEFDLFGKTVAHQLRKMTFKNQCVAEKLMNEILYLGKMDMLPPTTSINTNSNTQNL